MSKPIFERMEETLSRNDPRVWEVVSEKLAKDAEYWKRRALEASAVPCGHPFPPPPAMIEAPRPDAMEAKRWRDRAKAAEHANIVLSEQLAAARGTDHSPYFAAAERGTPSRPHPGEGGGNSPHAPLHRAIGRSQNGLPDPQTPNQVFWEKLLVSPRERRRNA